MKRLMNNDAGPFCVKLCFIQHRCLMCLLDVSRVRRPGEILRATFHLFVKANHERSSHFKGTGSAGAGFDSILQPDTDLRLISFIHEK